MDQGGRRLEIKASPRMICPCHRAVPATRKKYCSDQCAHKYSVINWQERKRAVGNAAKSNRTCIRCGNPFGAERRKDSLHCSRHCSERTNGKKKMARYRAGHPEEHRIRKKASYLRHRDTYIKLVLKRRFRSIDAEPKWLSPEDRVAIKIIYRRALERARDTGIKHEVDHVVPLQGLNVCGLHVPWNLQIMAASQNRAKSNKHV